MKIIGALLLGLMCGTADAAVTYGDIRITIPTCVPGRCLVPPVVRQPRCRIEYRDERVLVCERVPMWGYDCYGRCLLLGYTTRQVWRTRRVPYLVID